MTWKKRNIIIITMNFLALLLYMTTMLQRENPFGHTLTVILLAASGSLLVIRMETHMAFHAQTKQLQYQNLNLFRFLSSIIIIVLHARPFFTVSYEIDMAINNIIGRICVPFFFSSVVISPQSRNRKSRITSVPIYPFHDSGISAVECSVSAMVTIPGCSLYPAGIGPALYNWVTYCHTESASAFTGSSGSDRRPVVFRGVLSSLVFPGTSAFHACSALVEEEVFPEGTAYGFLCSSAVWRHRDLLRLLRSVFPIPASLLLCGFFHNP